MMEVVSDEEMIARLLDATPEEREAVLSGSLPAFSAAFKALGGDRSAVDDLSEPWRGAARKFVKETKHGR